MLVEITLSPSQLNDDQVIRAKLSKKIPGQLESYRLVRRWIDARQRPPRYGMRYEVGQKEEVKIQTSSIDQMGYQDVAKAEEVHIIGAGPAGYFAALEALRLGRRPILFEQGKDVRARRRDLRAIQQFGEVNPVSNYGFGEGGAGTYSDGKLYTRAKKRGHVEDVIQQLVAHGAPEDISVDAHPHIGSNKLPKIIANIRSTIEERGGEIIFNTKLVDIVADGGRVSRLYFEDGTQVAVRQVILATGHSARDVYDLFHQKDWDIEAKPFAIGCRIEHPQSVIDRLQYGQDPREDNLPAASYNLACQVEGYGVYSFCMCPGGLIVPASTAPGEIVVNGMSLSRRDSPYANSGFVTEIHPERLKGYAPDDALIGVAYQRQIERRMFELGDGSQRAPSQRVVDFLDGMKTKQEMTSSYIPGLFSARLDQELPDFIARRLQQGLRELNDRKRGYIHPEAILVGVESRTSAPVRIPREIKSLEHTQIKGLYPCGEGAGYAGGIMSAAMDGQRVLRAIVQSA